MRRFYMSNNYYYVSGHTSKGFVNYIQSNIHGINHVIIVNHPALFKRTKILREIQKALDKGQGMDVIYNPFGKDHLEGLIDRDRSMAILSEDLVTEEIRKKKDVYLLCDSIHHENLTMLEEKKKRSLEKAYKQFAKAIKVHDDLEKIYIDEMDFTKANERIAHFIEQLFKNNSKKQRETRVYCRLFGVTTPDGSVNVIPHLIRDMKRRTFLKGRAGNGKSVFMRRVAKACREYGYDLEIYHCSFDPDSIDMVRVPEMEFCIFDSTHPHEFFPENKQDQLIDLYEGTVTPGTDERFSEEIQEITEKYRKEMEKGRIYLGEAWRYQEQIEEEAKTYPTKSKEELIEQILEKI